MRGLSSDYSTEYNYSIVPAGLGHLLGYSRKLKCARYPGSCNILLFDVVTNKSINSAAEQLANDDFIETSSNDADLHSFLSYNLAL